MLLLQNDLEMNVNVGRKLSGISTGSVTSVEGLDVGLSNPKPSQKATARDGKSLQEAKDHFAKIN